MSISDTTRLIKERVNIVDVVSKYLKLQASSGKFKACCPFHREKTPSFYVNEDEQFYYCFGCGAGGDLINFVMRIESLTFTETVNKLCDDYGIENAGDFSPQVSHEESREKKAIFAVNRAAALYFHKMLKMNGDAAKYLESRGFNSDTVRRFALGFADNEGGVVEYLRDQGFSLSLIEKSGLVRFDGSGRVRPFFFNRVIVPIVNRRKEVVGFGGRVFNGGEPKYLNSRDSVIFNKKRELFGMNLLREGLRDYSYIVVTEGYFDVMAMHGAGIPTAVASLGTAVSADHLKLLKNYRRPVVLLMDGDAAGRRAMRRVIDLEIPEGMDIRAAFIPEEGEDPDSILQREGGRERLDSLIVNAPPIFQHYIDQNLEDYNRTDNLEEKVRIEKEVKDILSKVSKDRYRIYAEHVRNMSSIPVYLRYSNSAQKYERPVERRVVNDGQKDGDVRKIFHELFYISLRADFLIPSLSEIENTAVRLYDRENFIDFLLKTHEDGDLPDDLSDRLDPDGTLSEKYGAMSPDQLEINFRQKILEILYLDLDYKIRKLQLDDSEECRTEYRRLIQERGRLKREKARKIVNF